MTTYSSINSLYKETIPLYSSVPDKYGTAQLAFKCNIKAAVQDVMRVIQNQDGTAIISRMRVYYKGDDVVETDQVFYKGEYWTIKRLEKTKVFANRKTIGGMMYI